MFTSSSILLRHSAFVHHSDYLSHCGVHCRIFSIIQHFFFVFVLRFTSTNSHYYSFAFYVQCPFIIIIIYAFSKEKNRIISQTQCMNKTASTIHHTKYFYNFIFKLNSIRNVCKDLGLYLFTVHMSCSITVFFFTFLKWDFFSAILRLHLNILIILILILMLHLFSLSSFFLWSKH